ncbi:MAG TPA: FAD-binding oxidoreductase [Pyrinomonadaceae bacterium]|nr:FAD-binding oxidoreductase [Pyrinomonadaceae bacterium]
MRSAEVVIIGAGVVGASVAYHLASAGCRDVLVVERQAEAGRGSTGRATGGFRAQFSTEVNVRLSLLAREKLTRFADELGVSSGYEPRGYLFLARDETQLEALRAAQLVQQACGLREARMVEPEEARRLNPFAHADELAGAAFCPTDGFIRPLQILKGYRDGAARLGVTFEYDSPVEGFRTRGGCLESVSTKRGEVAAGCVVNAAGAWAAELARLAGAEIPVAPLRRQVAVTQPFDLLPAEMPMTIFTEDGFHLRARDGRVLLLWPDAPDARDPFDDATTDAWISEVVRRAHERVPVLKSASIDRQACWAGLYEMTPDRHALLGPSNELENFYLANGSSGHGVMHAPALGQLLAEIILTGRAHTLDTHALRPSRFREGQPNAACEFL